MYRSPIEILTHTTFSSLGKQLDDYIFQAVQDVGVNVDRDELLKALRYDRDQYQKGYKDGIASVFANLTRRIDELDVDDECKQSKDFEAENEAIKRKFALIQEVLGHAKSESYRDELEDALRMEAEAEDLQTSEDGIALVRWLRKRRRITRRIQRLERRMENA